VNKYRGTCIHLENMAKKYVQKIEKWCKKFLIVNAILHTAWLNNHAQTLKRNTAKYYFGEKSSFLHTFLKSCCASRKI
jgi:hypothetical protein